MTTNFLRFGIVGAAVLMTVSPALAQDDAATYSAGVTAGSLGVGPEVGFRPSPMFGVRGSASFLNVNGDFDVDDIDYRGKVKLESYGAVADFYPFKGGLRISGGFRINKNRVNVTATPTSNVTVGNVTYTPAQVGTLTGNVKTDEFAPVVTVGYAGGLTKGIKFGIDAGVMFQGDPNVQNLRGTGSLASNTAFLAEIERERVKFNDEIKDYRYYPVVQLSLFYAF